MLEKSDGGWWYIEIDNKEGWAPASYIQEYTHQAGIKMSFHPKVRLETVHVHGFLMASLDYSNSQPSRLRPACCFRNSSELGKFECYLKVLI